MTDPAEVLKEHYRSTYSTSTEGYCEQCRYPWPCPSFQRAQALRSSRLLGLLGHALTKISTKYAEGSADHPVVLGATGVTLLIAAMRHPEWAQAYIQQAFPSAEILADADTVAETLVKVLYVHDCQRELGGKS